MSGMPALFTLIATSLADLSGTEAKIAFYLYRRLENDPVVTISLTALACATTRDRRRGRHAHGNRERYAGAHPRDNPARSATRAGREQPASTGHSPGSLCVDGETGKSLRPRHL